MKNPFPKFRRFFVRSRTYNAAARAATQVPSDDDADSTRLSGAFIVVLALHIIAVVGVFAFARIKESRNSKTTAQGNPTQTAAPKNAPAKPATAKPAPVKPPAPAPTVAASLVPATPLIAPHATPKPATVAQNTPAPAEVKPAPATTQKATPIPADRKAVKTYLVKKNDSPMKIARDHGCTYEELMKVNNLKDPKKIQVGQLLKLPVKNG